MIIFFLVFAVFHDDFSLFFWSYITFIEISLYYFFIVKTYIFVLLMSLAWYILMAFSKFRSECSRTLVSFSVFDFYCNLISHWRFIELSEIIPTSYEMLPQLSYKGCKVSLQSFKILL